MSDKILEIGGAGLDANDERVRKLMDNLVNSEVPGYKKSEAVIGGFPVELDKAVKQQNLTKPQVEGSHYNFDQGSLIKTNSNLDLALAAEGFFVLAGPWGEGYTRDGRFQLDKDGRLLSVAGNYPLMSKSGPIVVTPGAELEFTQAGEIKVDGVTVDHLRVVMPEQIDLLEPLSGSLFKKKDQYTVIHEIETPRVIQGYIESSNVNPVESMMEMIMIQRQYGLDTKIINTRDSGLGKALEMGRLQ